MQLKNILKQMWRAIERSGKFDVLAFIAPKLFFTGPLFSAIMVAVITLGTEVLIGEASKGLSPSLEAICAMYPQSVCPDTITIVHYNNPGELYFALFLWGMFTPIIWWYYLSTPRMWTNLVKSLQKEGVIDAEKLQKDIDPILNNSFWLPSLAITLVILFLYIYGSIPSEIERGRLSFWLLTRHGEFLLIFFLCLHSFAIISFALKELILILRMRQFFNHNKIKKIHYFHVDQCGGFGAVGILATQISSLAVMIGVYAIWYSLLPTLTGGRMNFGVSTAVLYAAYAIFVPVFLLSLTSPVAHAMKRHKQELLMDVSRKLQAVLEGMATNDGTKNSPKKENGEKLTDRYKELQTLYEQLQLIPESPIRLLNLKRFTGFAIFPALFGSVSFAISVFDLLSKIREILGVGKEFGA